MNIPNDSLIAVLSQFNPWWRDEAIPDLPLWHRTCFQELYDWVKEPPAPRAVLLSGARQVGKTTLLLQVVHNLLSAGIPAANILYATFDHPIIKLAGIDTVVTAWREREPKMEGLEYVFMDEAQTIRDLGTWIKHQVDFNKNRRITFTGSAMPLISSGQESGVGRWHTIKLATLSFYEYMQLKLLPPPIFKDFLANLEKIKMDYEKPNYDYGKLVQSDLSSDKKIKFESDAIFANQKFKSDYSKLLQSNLFSNKRINLPELPIIKSLNELFDWPKEEFYRVSEVAEPYVGHFNQYLVRGGFPQTAQVESLTQAQRLIREDIVDKVLKRDMTALFGVRRVLDLEQIFLYLCMHDGGLLDMKNLCDGLSIKRPTAQHFIELLEASHLIYRLQPFSYGKEILRAKYKIYLADAAIASSVLLRGNTVLDNPTLLGIAAETAVFKHLYIREYAQDVRFSYWQDGRNYEIDLIAEVSGKIIPFEVKYRAQNTGAAELKGLIEFCQKKSIAEAYVITKSMRDFGMFLCDNAPNTKIMKIPAPLFCFWLGKGGVL